MAAYGQKRPVPAAGHPEYMGEFDVDVRNDLQYVDIDTGWRNRVAGFGSGWSGHCVRAIDRTSPNPIDSHESRVNEH